MSVIESFRRIAGRFPQANPKLTEFPSGAVTLDITIRAVLHCVEYFPSFDAYGLSKVEGAMPFWEGVDQSFTSAKQLEEKIVEMMNAP